MILQSQPSGADAWLVVAAPSSLLALPASESARAADLAARLRGPDGFRAALELLVGTGIASAPPFALLEGDAAVLRVVVRGDAALVARVAGNEVAFSGAGMATWTERVIEGATSLRLSVPGSSWTVLLDTEPVILAETTLAPPVVPEELGGGVPPTPGESAEPVAESGANSDEFAYDFLFGDTIYHTQAGASIRIPNPDPERPGDHDGQTMLATDLGRPAGPAAEPVSQVTVIGPLPPRSPAAAAESEHAPSLPLRPALQLERADGSREPLNRPVLIGRSPAASGAGSDVRLIAIADDPDISRTHLRVAVEGDAVVVTDLGSKNGSLITLPGAAPRKLRASEPTVVLPGTLIDLGGGTTFTVRED
ncbi:MAG TPA: FHA domain-containing protein [Pseudolysinimonas sp.]|nr:FHA domain-containing protein [Pseudolysinimonas sp.]